MRPASRSAGPDALRAAAAEAEQAARAARSARVADVRHGSSPAFRVGARSGRLGARAAVPADPSPPTPVPQPSPAPEGDTVPSQELVVRAQSGDADAFGELYDRYVDMVHRYLRLRVASPQVAEDLTSETFLRALRRIGSFTWQGSDIGAWFVTIARNLLADHYKSGRYRLELVTDDVGGSGPVPLTEGPERAVLTAMQNEVLLAAVRTLGAEQQECIALRFLQGMSVRETALVMGKSDGAVKALQHRAVRTLARLLAEGVER